MLLRQNDVESAYEQINQDAAEANGACSVLIFVAPNADGICACRILTNMLRSDVITYKVVPVSGYGDLERADAELITGNEDLRTVIMLNCGARRNMEKVLSGLPAKARVYVADAHRPVHLANLYSEEKIWVLDDGPLGMDEGILSDGDELSDGVQSDSDEDDDTDDDENAAASEAEEEPHSGSDANDSDEESLFEGERGETDKEERRKRKRQRTGPTPEERHALREAQRIPKERRRRLREYYHSDSYGQAAAYLLFDLAQRRGKDTNDALWLAIVGITDQFIHARIDQETYVSLVTHLEGHVVIRNPNPDEVRVVRATDGTAVPVMEVGRIAFEMEFRFMLHRHWSLYEAMYYSTYVASKLNVWTSAGLHKMEEFLAKMGLSLAQCKQKYQFMSANLRSRLKDQIAKYGQEYGLDDVMYGSFQRFMGFKTPYSAADVVYFVTALVEHRPSDAAMAAARAHQRPAAVAAAAAAAAAAANGMPQEDGALAAAEAQAVREEREAWMNSFNAAYDALGGRSPREVERGLEISMALQTALVQQAVSMMEKGALSRTTHFRYAYIHATEAGSQQIAQPCALARLAMLLIDVHRENKKWAAANSRPLILLAERRTTYLVVGVNCPERAGEVSNSRFGASFELAAQHMNAKVRLDGFDRNVVEVPREQGTRFVELVYETMDA